MIRVRDGINENSGDAWDKLANSEKTWLHKQTNRIDLSKVFLFPAITLFMVSNSCLLDICDMCGGVGIASSLFLDIYKNIRDLNISVLDASREALKIGSLQRPDFGFYYADVNCLKSFYENFDFVLFIQALEHMQDPEKALTEIKRTLKPGGAVLLTTPIENRIDGDKKHVWSFTPPDIFLLLSAAGFSEVTEIPFQTSRMAFFGRAL